MGPKIFGPVQIGSDKSKLFFGRSKIVFNIMEIVERVKFSSENWFLDRVQIENIFSACPKKFEPVQNNLDL